MNCEAYYRALLTTVSQVLDASFTPTNIELQANSHAFVSELDTWHTVLRDRAEAMVLQKASVEYQFGLLLVASGYYRYAFTGLRATLELALTLVDHSAHAIHHREWCRGARDIKWAALVSPEASPLSKPFCDSFFPELRDEVDRIRALAVGVYRACSEHVHGNPGNELALPSMLSYSEEAFSAWHDAADSSRYVIRFLLAMRYLSDLSSDQLASVEPYVTEHLSHLAPIQAFFSSPRE